MSTDHSSLSLRHLKDWPHRRVVSMQSSVRLKGSLRHSDVLSAPIAAVSLREGKGEVRLKSELADGQVEGQFVPFKKRG